jgi:predicted lactoylglutathione lyase
MASIEFVTIEVADPAAADRFYTAAFGLGTRVRLRVSEAPTTGFRGFTLSLVVSQPATVNGFIGAAIDAGATPLKPAAKSLWGYGGVVQAADGTMWTVASSAKKDTGPATRQIDEIVLQLGVADVAASKRFYVDRGFAVAKSYGRRYVELGTASSPVNLTLYGAACPRQGRRRRSRRHRIAPARDWHRCWTLHRPGRVRVGGRIALTRAAQHNCITAGYDQIGWTWPNRPRSSTSTSSTRNKHPRLSY